MVPGKHLSIFLRTLEIRSINCEIILQLKWTKDCIKLLQQLQSDLKITLNWIKYLPKKHPKRKTDI